MTATLGLNDSQNASLARRRRIFRGSGSDPGPAGTPRGRSPGLYHAGGHFCRAFQQWLLPRQGGYEYALVLLAVSVSLVSSGAGRASLDRALSVKSE